MKTMLFYRGARAPPLSGEFYSPDKGGELR